MKTLTGRTGARMRLRLAAAGVSRALVSLRWRYRWATYELFAMRPAYARDCAQMAVAFGHEADAHYGVGSDRVTDGWRYAGAWLSGILCRRLPDAFMDGWFAPVTAAHTHSSDGTNDGSQT